MKKLTTLGLLALSSLASFSFVFGQTPAVKMGFVLPLQIWVGQSYRDIAILAKEDFASTFGAAKTKLSYEFIFEDNNYESTRTNLIAQKFVDVDHVRVIASVWGLWANIVEPRVAGKDILHVTSAYDFKHSLQSPSLNAAPENKGQIILLLRYLQANNIHRLALAYVYESGQMSWINELKSLAPKYGVTIVDDQKILDTERDFRVRLLKIRESKPEALWLGLWDPVQSIFLKQYRELGLKTPLYSIDDAYFPESIKNFEGTVGLLACLPQNAWVAKFKKRFGYEPTSYAWPYYTLVQSLMNAYETLYEKLGRMPTASEVSAFVKGQHYAQTPLGEMSYDHSGRLVNQSSLIKIIGGKIVPFTLE